MFHFTSVNRVEEISSFSTPRYHNAARNECFNQEKYLNQTRYNLRTQRGAK